MFESPKSRQDFLQALRGGKISPQVIQKATAEINSFADTPIADMGWALANPNPNIKGFGHAVIMAANDPNKGAALLDLYNKERRPVVQAEIAAAMANCKCPEALSLLAKMVNDKNVDVRAKALEMFTGQADWHQNRAMVTAFLEDPNDRINGPMLEKVIAAAPRAYATLLRLHAAGQNSDSREKAIRALIAMNNLKNADVFLARLPFEGEALKRELHNAVGMMIQTNPEAMTERIIHALASTETKVCENAMALFVRLPKPQHAFRELLKFTDATTAFVRDQVFSQLLNHADHFAGAVMEIFKSEQDSAIRLQAMNLAKQLKHEKLAPIFLHEMKNPDWLIRYTAMQTLGEMKSQQALPVLVEALNSPDAAMAAIQALDKYRDIRVAKPLFQKLNGALESEQIEILKALENIGDPRFLPHMAKFLDSSAPKGKAKKFAAETIISMCGAHNKVAPPRVLEINEQLSEKTLSDLPDLGLKMSAEG